LGGKKKKRYRKVYYLTPIGKEVLRIIRRMMTEKCIDSNKIRRYKKKQKHEK